MKEYWGNNSTGISHLWCTIDVEHQGFILRNDKPGFLPATPPSLLHVVQETAQDAVLCCHGGLFLLNTHTKRHRRGQVDLYSFQPHN